MTTYDCYIKKRKTKITNDYKNGIIKSQNEYIKIMDKLDSDYLNSIENSNKCEIANCYKSVKQYIDYLSDKKMI